MIGRLIERSVAIIIGRNVLIDDFEVETVVKVLLSLFATPVSVLLGLELYLSY